ncbi:Peptide deformylase [hydrothermal vent metagenome]|uniref:Peptide deformylase n=1 Tax=hydrothermal vent metagenome TaxID=652676 RepID=A0A3B1B054_9ZZZZ
MPVKNVLKMGHPILQQVAEPVTEFNSALLDSILVDMYDTMVALDGAGLAAPQIGIRQRIVIFCVEDNPRYPDIEPVPDTVLINPEVSFLSDELVLDWEGCLSVPGLRGRVPRCNNIKYRGYDQYGNVIERIADDFHARVVLHEVDHLDGVLYPQRMEDMSDFGFEQELFP